MRKAVCSSGLRTAIAFAGLVGLVACARPPLSVHPAVIGGTMAAAGELSAPGTAAAGAPLGPLELTQARVRVLGDVAIWSVDIGNRSSERLGATLVLRVMNAAGDVIAYDSVTLLIGGNDNTPVQETLQTETAGLVEATSWRLECWVRRLPPPERRRAGIGD